MSDVMDDLGFKSRDAKPAELAPLNLTAAAMMLEAVSRLPYTIPECITELRRRAHGAPFDVVEASKAIEALRAARRKAAGRPEPTYAPAPAAAPPARAAAPPPATPVPRRVPDVALEDCIGCEVAREKGSACFIHGRPR